MKNLLCLTAFMLFSLCSYSQLVVTNSSPYTITVGASFEVSGDCLGGSDNVVSIASGNTGTMNATLGDWTVFRAEVTDLGPLRQVVKNSDCGTGCATELSTGITANWNGSCNRVTVN